MKMRKIIFTFMFSLISVAVSFSQSKGVTIDNALTQAAEKFSSSLKNRTTVAILGISSSYNELSEYMLGELTTDIVQLRKLQVVTRANLDVIKKEMNFQLSGEVSDETMQQLGAKTGAQTVISGTFKPLGTLYVLDIQAFDVTTATIQDTYRVNVVSDETLELLTKKKIVGTSGKIQANDYTAGERLGIGFQNILLGLGSYRNGHWGDGILMTAADGIAILCAAYGDGSITGTIIGASIAYGFVRPFFYHKNNSVNLSMNIGAIPTAHGVEPGVSYRLSW
ncbi:CsgG/HfaB family protein [Treponema succinifaciens]|uniref:CsgG/HfaB family protein n=1 Tax=Treponema succinifaciens TaxID=167 RepID=UPI002599A324|nr:CsgG/HfaB family protein [Treponema succinifaciens]MDY2615787.1 CsgG/HfaB family protein [Treponema succinifaciens]